MVLKLVSTNASGVAIEAALFFFSNILDKVFRPCSDFLPTFFDCRSDWTETILSALNTSAKALG
jgi:hypothetical protein